MHLLFVVLAVIVIVKALEKKQHEHCSHEHIHRCSCGKEF